MEEKCYFHRNGREIITDVYLVLILAQCFDKVFFYDRDTLHSRVVLFSVQAA